MTSRRNLVSRARLNESSNLNSSPAQRRQRDENREPTPLPPYEPPSYPLTASGKRALDDLANNHIYNKYQKHITESKKLLPAVVGDCNDRLRTRKEQVVKRAAKRQREGRGDDERTEAELEADTFADVYGKKVENLTRDAEKAMRDLIDYSDELAMQETLLRDVSESIAAASAPAPIPARKPRQRRPRNEDSDEDAEEEEEEEEVETLAEAIDILSATELLKRAREDYTTTYTSKTMLERYENNDYKGFKRAVHEALNPGDDAPPLPRASKWFPQDRTHKSNMSSSRRQTTAENEEDSDDEIYISGAKIDFKCPLSLTKLEEPYTSKICKHTYEKRNIINYINDEGTYFTQSQPRGPKQKEKQIRCIVIGCDNMLKISEFYDDVDIVRQMKRANRQAAYDMDEDEEEDQAPRGTQRSRPEELDESEEESRRRTIVNVKAERQSLGVNSTARSSDDEMED